MLADRWAQADAAEAAIGAWHEQHGRCPTKEDKHVVRIDGDERPADCHCPSQPCGGVASRDIHGDCPWHSEMSNPCPHYSWSGHYPEACPGPASGM